MVFYYFLDPARIGWTIFLMAFAIAMIVGYCVTRDWTYLTGIMPSFAYFIGMPLNPTWRYTREQFNELKNQTTHGD